MKEPIVVCFSGGKDSLLMLHELNDSEDFQIVRLVTTVTTDYERISMHGVRRQLLRAQVSALGMPLQEVVIPAHANNAVYEIAMGEAWEQAAREGIRKVAFGDIFLQDLKDYRLRHLSQFGLAGIFPLWEQDTNRLLRQFIDCGYRAVTVCVDPKRLDETFVGRELDAEFLNELPAGVDPCGENGEFHSFVYDGPLFRTPVRFARGETVVRDSFYFCDLVPE